MQYKSHQTAKTVKVLNLWYPVWHGIIAVRHIGSSVDNTPFLKKLCHFYFLNNSVKHWLISIIFDTKNHDTTWN